MADLDTRAVTARGREGARRAQRSPAVDLVARLGIISRGGVYVVVGVLAILIAVGHHDQSADQRGALETIAAQPFGRVALVLLVVGFAGYALWQLLDAIGGHQEADDSRRRLRRLRALVAGLLYAAFAVSTAAILVGSGGSSSSSGREQGWTARLLTLPFGRALVGLTGAVVIGVGIGLAWWTAAGHYQDTLKKEEMGPLARGITEKLGAVGHGARALVAMLLGVFLVRAAVTYDPGQARGLDGALRILATGTAGRTLILVAAAGLIAHGLFSLLEARYRRI